MTTDHVPERLSRRTVFRGRVVTLEADRVKLPNGRVVSMEVVRHAGSVVIIPQPSPTSVILIRQYRYAIGRWIWELPAGSLEPDERPVEAVRRECEEEIGLTPGEVRRVAVFYPTPGFCDERMIFYRCRRLRPPVRPRAGDEDEQIEPRTFTLTEARRLIRTGRIVDMKTVAGLGLIGR